MAWGVYVYIQYCANAKTELRTITSGGHHHRVSERKERTIYPYHNQLRHKKQPPKPRERK